MKIWRNRIADSIDQSISDEGVCRTAPATPDLLKSRVAVVFFHIKISCIWENNIILIVKEKGSNMFVNRREYLVNEKNNILSYLSQHAYIQNDKRINTQRKGTQ